MTTFPQIATKCPFTLAKIFNEWFEPLVDRTGQGTEGFYTEDGTDQAKNFMDGKGLPSIAIEDAKKAIAAKCGYDNVRDLGLEHEVGAAWKANPYEIMFYCELQGKMFVF
jgi:hypothetical protein